VVQGRINMGGHSHIGHTAPVVVVVMQLVAARGRLGVVDGAVWCRVTLGPHLGLVEADLVLDLLALLLGHPAELYSCKGGVVKGAGLIH